MTASSSIRYGVRGGGDITHGCSSPRSCCHIIMAHRFTMRKKASLEIEQHDNGDWTATVKVDKERGERVDVFEGPRGAQVLKKAGNKLRNILFSTL